METITTKKNLPQVIGGFYNLRSSSFPLSSYLTNYLLYLISFHLIFCFLFNIPCHIFLSPFYHLVYLSFSCSSFPTFKSPFLFLSVASFPFEIFFSSLSLSLSSFFIPFLPIFYIPPYSNIIIFKATCSIVMIVPVVGIGNEA